MANNPIQSHDLYTPGPQDTLAALKKELVAIQEAVRALDAQARSLKKVLSSGVTSPAKVVAAATEADMIASKKRIILLREEAVKTKIATQAKKQDAIAEQQVAAATSRANIARQREIDYANRAANANKKHHTSLTGLIGSIRNLAYAYFTLGAASQIFQNILKQTKALDTLTVAFNTTLGSTQATAQAQEYLLDISERFGANLLGASQAYLKFSAASTQAGVSAEETQKIFTSVTKASSILGLGAERTSYVFLALEQIMSKGRLSTEELRRQLGEHLPGAFGIAAEAMGVTTAKLTDMLKKGQIASTDFLPKFAAQLEKAYGIDQVEKIDNLAAAQERFNNQLTLLIKDLDLSDAFKDLFNNLASLVKVLADNASGIVTLGKALFQLGLAWAAWKTALIATNALQTVNLGIISRSIRMQGLFATATILAGRAMKSLGAAIAANPLGAFLSVVILLWPQINRLADAIMGVTEGARAMKDSIDDMRLSVIEETESVKKQISVLGDLNSTQAERLEAFNSLQAAYPGILNSYNLEKIALSDLVTLEQQLTTAIVERAKASRKAQIQTDLLKDLEEANRATPFGLLLNSKESADQQTLNLRENLRVQAFNLAAEKLNALDQASLDLSQFLQEQINSGDDILQQDALRLKYRAKEVELQKELSALTDDELIKIVEAEKAKGRSFGQVDPFFNLRQSIAKEILAKRKKPDELDGDGSGKDPRLVEIERLQFINSLRKDSLEKDLEALALNVAEKKILHEKDAQALIAIENWKYAQVLAIREKYIATEEELQRAQIEEQLKGYEAIAKAVSDAFAARASGNRGQTLEQFEEQQEHELRIFKLKEDNADKIARFEIQQEIAKLDFILKLNELHGKQLTQIEIDRINELKAALGQELLKPFSSGGSDNEADIFSVLGINWGGKSESEIQDFKDAFSETISFIGDELKNFNQLQQELIDQQIEDADRLVRAKEENLNRQIALQAANQANNVAGAQAELALAKKTQEEAIKQRKAAQRQELAIETLSQTQNMITAVTAALKLGPILGPIAVGALFAVFAASKIKALQLINKKTFRKGGFEEIGGGSHESGRDTHVGGGNYAERGESVGIFTNKATRKYKPTLKALVNAANKGTLENILIQDRRAIQGINMINKTDVDTSLMEKRLTRLVSLSESKTFVDGRGRLVRIDRGRKTIINR